MYDVLLLIMIRNVQQVNKCATSIDVYRVKNVKPVQYLLDFVYIR